MRLKKVSFAVISGVAALSVFALTSCGDKESVDISSYSNEITEEKFYEETEKFHEEIDLEDGYEFTKYSYSKSDGKTNDQKQYSEVLRKEVEKYDKINNIYYESLIYNYEDEDPSGKTTSNATEEGQIQKDGETSYRIDLKNKAYQISYYGSPENSARDYFNLIYYYQEALYSAAHIIPDITDTKYFKDNDVFTVEIKVNKDKQNTYNNEQTDDIKETVDYDGKYVIQFYAKDDTYYLAFDSTLKGTTTTSKGDKKHETTGEYEATGYVKIIKKNPTIEKLDLSKYKFYFDNAS